MREFFLYDLVPVCYERQRIRSYYQRRYKTLPTRIYTNEKATKNAKVLGKPQLVITKATLEYILQDMYILQEKRNRCLYRSAIKAVKDLLALVNQLDRSPHGSHQTA